MALAALKKPKIERDRFTEDGVRLFNITKEHGVIYADGFIEAKYLQEYEGEAILYRGDGAPIGYEHGVPMPKKAEELLTENEALQARIKDLEDSQRRTNELLEKLTRGMSEKPATAAPEPASGTPAPKPTPSQLKGDLDAKKATEAPARGATKPA